MKIEEINKKFGTKYTDEEFKKLKDVLGISEDNPLYKSPTITVKAVDGEGEDLIEFKISSQNTDRDGDIILQEGLDVSNVGKNMPVLFAHNHDWVIGHWKEMYRGEDGDMYGKASINPEASIPGVGVNILNAIKRGDLAAVSIGFLIKEYEWIDPEDYWSGLFIKKAEIIECSIVAVGANKDAIIADGKSLKNEGGVEMGEELKVDNAIDENVSDKGVIDEESGNVSTDDTDTGQVEPNDEDEKDLDSQENVPTDTGENTPSEGEGEKSLDIENIVKEVLQSDTFKSTIKEVMLEINKEVSAEQPVETPEDGEKSNAEPKIRLIVSEGYDSKNIESVLSAQENK